MRFPAERRRPSFAGPLAAAAAMLGLLLLGIAASLLVGDVPIDAATVFNATVHHDSQLSQHVIVRDWRLPRAVADVLVGAALAVAGAIMQAVTRNPLASPGIMGLNTGASFATVLAMVLLPTAGRPELMLVSIAGAALGAALVYGLASLSRGGLTPVRLALTGIAVSALLGRDRQRGDDLQRIGAGPAALARPRNRGRAVVGHRPVSPLGRRGTAGRRGHRTDARRSDPGRPRGRADWGNGRAWPSSRGHDRAGSGRRGRVAGRTGRFHRPDGAAHGAIPRRAGPPAGDSRLGVVRGAADADGRRGRPAGDDALQSPGARGRGDGLARRAVFPLSRLPAADGARSRRPRI